MVISMDFVWFSHIWRNEKVQKKIVLTVQVIFCIVFLSIRSTSLSRFIDKQYYLYRIDLLHYDKRSFKNKLQFNMLIRSCRHMIRKINKKTIFNVIRQLMWSLYPHNASIFNNPLINYRIIKLMNKLIWNGWKQH